MIETGISKNIRRPGTYHSHLYSDGARSFVAGERRIVLLAIKAAAGTLAVDTPTEVQDVVTADALAGRGSELALMFRATVAQALRDCQQGAKCPRIFLNAVAAPSGGGTAAAAETITVTGTATASGPLRLRIAGRAVVVNVTAGDANTAVAAAIEAEIDRLVDILPVTAAVASNVVTCTHVTAGVNGNDVRYRVEANVPGITIALAQSVAGAGTVDLTTSLDVLATAKYHGIAVANNDSNDVSDLLAHLAATVTATAKKWRRVFLVEPGTIGTATTSAASFNTTAAHVLCCEGAESPPGELAAAACVSYNIACDGRPNPNLNGRKLVGYPPIPSNAFTDTEVETALGAGVTPLVPVVSSAGVVADGLVQIVKLVTTQTTVSSVSVELQRFPAASEVGWYLADLIDARWVREFGPEANPEGSLMDGTALDRAADIEADVLFTAEEKKIVRQVKECLPLLQNEIDADLADRINADLTYVPVLPIGQGAFLHRITQKLTLGA